MGTSVVGFLPCLVMGSGELPEKKYTPERKRKKKHITHYHKYVKQPSYPVLLHV